MIFSSVSTDWTHRNICEELRESALWGFCEKHRADSPVYLVLEEYRGFSGGVVLGRTRELELEFVTDYMFFRTAETEIEIMTKQEISDYLSRFQEKSDGSKFIQTDRSREKEHRNSGLCKPSG